ncbi:hypothetical protein, conserved [Plasmodium vivax]|nr:hypothetical protein, conserved [Plasmodium vivax]
MPCSKHYKGYLSYKCYEDIKKQFGEKINKNNYSISENISKFAKNYEADIGTKLNGLSDVFTNLKKYLSNGHVFTSGKYNGLGTCNYISYLLCNQIRENIYGECDKDTFNLLKDFVDRYNKSPQSSMCKNMLKPLNNDDFKRVKDLYQLYDKFIDLSPYYEYVPEHYCQNMLDLFRLHNTFLHENKSSSLEFNNILTQFKVLIDPITKTGKKHCTNELYSIGTPHLYEPHVEEIQPTTITSLRPESKLSNGGKLYNEVRPKPPELISSSMTSVGEEQRIYTENSQRSEKSDPLEAAATSVPQKHVERGQSHEDPEHLEQHAYFGRQQSYVSPGTYGPGSNYEQVGHIETNEIFPPRGDSFVVTEPLVYGPGKENTGFMTNVQSAISGFMKDVDPVPVVGVSGGMGALFLLFRYTPVGAFFRGGRRMNNRIPSRFSGQILGGFPGYEEFYDGGFANGPINISYRPELE